MKKIVILVLCFASIGSTAVIKSKKQEKKRPNILFLIADDAGKDFSAYGSSFTKTPAFDAIAKNGLLFNRAYTPNAKCAPSRSCILTGRNSWQLEEGANHWIYFPSHFKTFPEALKDGGYQIGFTGKGYAPGKSLDQQGKQRDLVGASYDTFRVTPPTTGISRIDYAANFQNFLSQVEGEKPWFFWVGFNEPHRPYEYASGVQKGKKTGAMVKHIPGYLPDADTVRNDLLDYGFEIEYLDQQVAKILKSLEGKGELENTIIVYTSDHGMPFPRVKGNEYENANHIPMAVMWKNGIKHTGRTVEDYISFIDLAPSFLDAAGITIRQSGMHPITGTSLLNIFYSSKNGQIDARRNYVLVGQERHDFGRPHDVGYPIRGIHKNGMLYLKNYEPDRWPACNPETGYLNCDGGVTKTFILNQRRSGVEKKYWKLCFGHRVSEELYDTNKDPDCINNLISLAKYKPIAAALKTEMEQKLKEQGDLRMAGFGHLYEQYPFAEVNGFYERYMNGEKIRTGWVNATDYETGPVDDY